MNALRHARNGAAAAALAGLVAGGTQLVLGAPAQGDWGTLTASTYVNVRTGPGTNTARLGTLATGEAVRQTGPTRNGWTPVTWKGRKGYVFATYLSSSRTLRPDASSTATASTMRTTEAVNVRSGPSTSYSRVATLRGGTVVATTGARRGVWLEVLHRGAKRWMHSAYLASADSTDTGTQIPAATQPNETTTGSIRAKATTLVNVRAGSSVNSARLGLLQQGTIVRLTGTTTRDFSQVIWQGRRAWVASRYLVKVSSSTSVDTPKGIRTIGVRYARTDLNIRATGEPRSRVVAVVPTGTKLPITGEVRNGLAQVVHNGALRWASLTYLSMERPAAAAVAPTTTGSLDVNGCVGLDAMRPTTKRVALVVRQQFPAIKIQYGVRRDPYPDHPSGRAVDNMIPNYRSNQALGWEIAHYLQAHASELNIQYIIFGQRIWSVARADEGWRWMNNRGSDTANHYDHVHVTVNY